MRSLGKKVFSFCNNGKSMRKNGDFQNHRRFSLKSLKFEVIPVSIRLKTNARTAKGLAIIRKTERKLLN